MPMHTRLRLATASLLACAALTTAGTSFAQDYTGNSAATPTVSSASSGSNSGSGASADNSIQLQLSPSSAQLAACMPNADVRVHVDLTTDKTGSDTFHVSARHIAPNTDFTVFLLEQAATPFGAAEYIGDLTTDSNGNGDAQFQLIVQEAFSSTLVNGQRVRVDLNRVGMWFADPKSDDFCLGPDSPVTPFDGDNEAGVQAFNSANADPLPAP